MASQYHRFFSIAVLVAMLSPSLASGVPYERIKLLVQSQAREALVVAPEKMGEGAHPLIFVFHGHGGTMLQAALKFECEAYWPGAIVVYPQGLKTPGGIVDPEGKFPGWQMNSGDEGDRDLAFFDALLSDLEARLKVDSKRIYVMGHSNGGLFAYELWAARGETIAAIGCIAAIIPTKTERAKLKPMPIFHAAGKNDPLVKLEWQLESMEAIKRIDGCVESEKEAQGKTTRYRSALGCDLVTYIGDGGHEIPDDAIPLIVDFFKEWRLR